MLARRLHAMLVAANLFWYQAIRQTVGVLVVAMGDDLGFGTKEKGWLIAAPSVGNIMTQLLGGMLEAALGARLTIGIAVSGLGIGCVLVPPSCTYSLSLGLLVLACQGFVFGPMFPAHSVLLSRWLLSSERGWASAQGELAISLASIAAPLLIASLNTAVGWQAGFYSVGSCCLLYVAFVWLRLAASSPALCSYVTKEELAQIQSHGDSSTASKPAAQASATAPVSWVRVLLHPAIIALFSCHAIYNLTTLSINSWMPSYYNDVLHLRPDEARLHLTVPHITAIGIKLSVSGLAERTRARGLSLLGSRRLMCAVGYAITGVPMLLVPLLSAGPAWLSTLCFSIALAGTGFHAEGFRANYLDVTREHVGLVSGVGNCLSSVAAMVAPLIVGSLVEAFGWPIVWRAVSAGCAVAAAIFCGLSSASPVEVTLTSGKKHD